MVRCYIFRELISHLILVLLCSQRGQTKATIKSFTWMFFSHFIISVWLCKNYFSLPKYIVNINCNYCSLLLTKCLVRWYLSFSWIIVEQYCLFFLKIHFSLNFERASHTKESNESSHWELHVGIYLESCIFFIFPLKLYFFSTLLFNSTRLANVCGVSNPWT